MLKTNILGPPWVIATLTRCIWSVTILTYAIRNNNEDRSKSVRGGFCIIPNGVQQGPNKPIYWGLFIGSTADYVYIYIYTYLEYISNEFYELNKCRSIYNAWWTVRRTGFFCDRKNGLDDLPRGPRMGWFFMVKLQKWLGKSAREWSQSEWFSYNGHIMMRLGHTSWPIMCWHKSYDSDEK